VLKDLVVRNSLTDCLTSKPPGQFGLEKEWMV
jgi:hypothetical protein